MAREQTGGSYLFFIQDELPKQEAHIIQVVQCANAAANLGLPTVLAHLDKSFRAMSPISWVSPFQLQVPEHDFANFFNTQKSLKLLPLSVPWPIGRLRSKLTNSSTFICKYYFPIHLAKRTKLVHTRDWNFAKAAIKCGVPVIYECHHHEKKKYETDFVNHPLFQVAVTVVETVRENMISNGIPREKTFRIHNGYNHQFSVRHSSAASEWREKLLINKYEKLVVYAGALYPFKGIDVLLQAAKSLPTTKFALAGGPEEQLQKYKNELLEKKLVNVELLGFLPQQELASLLQAADALVHPHCLGEAATFTSPLKLFDYMASGTPIVATKIPSLVEFYASPAIAGWCEPDNPEKLIECLCSVLTTHPRKIEGYRESLDFVEQFSWENRISKILERVNPEIQQKLFLTKGC
ncbi:MAG TPA: glycosyltransferase family 4 protein [Leptolyngbyaceae cyanobacterium]